MLAYDVGSMHEVLDRLLRTVSVESAIRDVLLPFMAHVGRGWEAGDFDVADEHFASDLVRGRLAALAVGPGTRPGPTVLLADPGRHRGGHRGLRTVRPRTRRPHPGPPPGGPPAPGPVGPTPPRPPGPPAMGKKWCGRVSPNG